MESFMLLLMVIMIILQAEVIWVVFCVTKNYYEISTWIYEVDKDLEVLERKIYLPDKVCGGHCHKSDNPYQE